MCYEVRCLACGKSTWGGCGRHVQSVYNRIEEAQRCLCKEWPGINTNTNSNGRSADKSANPSASLSSSNCNIL